VKVATIAGCNLPEPVLRSFDITVAPQYIVVDEERHDTRTGIPLESVERWVKSSRVHPYVLSGSTAEFATMFRTLAQQDRDLVMVVTGRGVIGSYATAVAAARVVKGAPGLGDLNVEVIDSNSMDIGSGLVTLFAAMAAKEGLPRAKVVEVVDAFVKEGVSYMMPDSVEYLGKGGHAGFVKTILANVLDRRPILSLPNGKMTAIASVSRKLDPVMQLMTEINKVYREGRPLWVGIGHGRAPELAERLEATVRERYDVRYLAVRRLQSSIYLNTGPSTLSLFAFPVDRLPWKPSQVPPPV
jgi:DegV family protein with EDD domain